MTKRFSRQRGWFLTTSVKILTDSNQHTHIMPCSKVGASNFAVRPPALLVLARFPAPFSHKEKEYEV